MKRLEIFKIFIVWRVVLFAVSALAILFITDFGVRFPYYNTVLEPTGLPSWVWGFGNFDGVHYLRIAQDSYSAQYSQAFFPLYPLLIRIFTEANILLPKDPNLDTRIYVDPTFFYSGLILSNLILLIALYFFYKLVILDYKKEIGLKSIILLLAFPTAFYFGSIYTESLFLLLVVGFFYLMRKQNFIAAGVLAGLASATRIFGLLLLPVFLAELYLKIKNKEISLKSEQFVKALIGILLAPTGILLYMLYLRFEFDNPLYFLTSQPLFGAERRNEIILLPQVLFRYIKIFLTVSPISLPFFNAFLEFSFTLIALGLLFVSFKKIRFSYFIFTFGSLLLPTLTGTLSSMPRYSLMSFLMLPFLVRFSGRHFKLVVVSFILLQMILVGLFTRGYWVA
ncbi:hypothetical protein HYS96_02450 [Candidatus Daviesbacteria bacterium]|nr:hypothetical protein [Candidatus Daviesbacteria bacterium]